MLLVSCTGVRRRLLTAKLGVDVKISVEIEAKSLDGFDEALQRTAKENCTVLRFSNAEFKKNRLAA